MFYIYAILDRDGNISEEGNVIEPYENLVVFDETNPPPANTIKTNDRVKW